MGDRTVGLVWFRRALRLADNPALAAALAENDVVVPVFILSPYDPWPVGAASRAWLARSLVSLDASLREFGSSLVVREGAPFETLATLAAECGATTVYADRRFEPDAAETEAGLKGNLSRTGLQLCTYNCTLLNPPNTRLSKDRSSFKVFTPYYRAALAATSPEPPTPAPERIPSPETMPESLDITAVLADAATGAPDLDHYFTPGEVGAQDKASHFFAENVADYVTLRDLPATYGTSRLSPHLAFGEISPRQLVADAQRTGGEGAEAFVRQLYWREFAYQMLHHHPATYENPLRPEFARFPWAFDPEGLEAWMTGQTGYPIVDAGMRELNATGWMHNRVRMVVASFLTKDLLLPWQTGMHFFEEWLIDADMANNVFGWQWIAGSGADAAPYFRIFNPVIQGATYDRWGGYVREWVPELAALPDKVLHRPWEAPDHVLADAGVRLGETYPRPIIDHQEARVRALAAYGRVKGSKA